ncbi:MAG: ArsS family sensor histidine kinase [Campylobacterota bacterium]
MSITKKIATLFLVSLTLMTIIGLWIDNINTQRINNLVKDKYLDITNKILQNINNKDSINELLNTYSLEIVKQKNQTKGETLYYKKYTFGFVHIFQEKFEDEFILHVKYLNNEYMLKTDDEQNLNDRRVLNILIFLDIFLLVATFLYIIKLIYPLKKITDNINSFAKGKYSTRVKIYSNDEVGTLAKTFNKMAYEIQESIKTRENLLRDIGHELRTPIAKGNFAIEKINNLEQKKLLKKIFKDLEVLTNELIQLEKLNQTKLKITSFDSETLILESLDKLYLEDESKIDLRINTNFTINGDLYYLSIALKNLIDNALKYSTTLPIIIDIKENRVFIKNKGDKLNEGLDYYIRPFTQELPQRDGFGLGLSIVIKILKKHNFELKYKYDGGYNIFIVNL